MTSLKLFYRKGAPAALLLGLIVGAPDIAHAVQLRGGFYPSIQPRSSSLPPPIPPRISSLPPNVNKPLPTRPQPAPFPPSSVVMRSIGTQTETPDKSGKGAASYIPLTHEGDDEIPNDD